MFIFIYICIYICTYISCIPICTYALCNFPSLCAQERVVAHASAKSALKLPLGHSLDGLHKP